tara:strand:- start:640 stop:1266 length:627 start_codon:yes stop_codon:yes gene_type:complete
MNISKFLLIDAVLLIAAIPLFSFIQNRNKKSYFLRNSNKENLLEKTSIKLPEKETLITLEKIAEVQGSGIEFDSLTGNWKFVSVWMTGTDAKDSIISSLLRVFSAKLELKNDLSIENLLRFSISTSIQFGILSIKFSGNGYLKGHRPYLPFSLNLIELKSGSNVLLSKSLEEPLKKEKSFFALIASEKSGNWLSARGQGGALILWLKD